MDLVWFSWSLLLLCIWGLVYALLKNPESRHEMLVVSAWTSLLAVTEPLFVPRYWNPPSLFGLAQSTGFDIESFIFSFAIGGLAVVLYELAVPVRHVPLQGKRTHLYHPLALVFTPLLFAAITLFSGINPIYSAIIALIAGGCLVLVVRGDLFRKMLSSAVIFLGLYSAYFLTLVVFAPGYVQRVWDLKALSGFEILGIPLEELAFAFSFGFFWSGVYEYALFKRLKEAGRGAG
ncbi:MAG TPA: lycopene cyclase domain-containing protein [Methanomicrobiales archaeon]|nr:lycopene cyclase domain-containing protein [Methanomicrobiales archaeon]